VIDRRALITYDLVYWGDDPETEAALVRVLAKIPEDVCALALRRCWFISVGGATHAHFIPAEHAQAVVGRAVIVMADGQGRQLDSVIAHEVAHAMLGHGPATVKGYDEQEEEARRLAAEWGFGPEPGVPPSGSNCALDELG
jgi:hypothetical protein